MSDKLEHRVENQKRALEWGIREFAAFFNITTRAVRFYEDKGLLSPKRRNSGRIFTSVDYYRLENILRAKRLGFTLDNIKQVLDVTDGQIQDRDALLQRKDDIERTIASLHRRRKDIDILTKDMTEICQIISETVVNMPTRSQNSASGTSDEIFDLAARYEAAFKDKMSFQGTADVVPNNADRVANNTATHNIILSNNDSQNTPKMKAQTG